MCSIVPFNPKTGNLWKGEEVEYIEWRSAEPFRATLELVYYRSGRHNSSSVWRDDQGVEYIIFVSEIFKALRTGTFSAGKITGIWGYTKIGTAYSLKYLGEDYDTLGV